MREMIKMPIYYAHTGSDSEDVSTWQLLSDHLNNVADKAAEFASVVDMPEWGRALGLLHDAGKASEAFQQRLRGSKEQVDHSTAGAKISIENYQTIGLFMAYNLAGHHGGQPNLVQGDTSTPLQKRLKKTLPSFDAYKDMFESGLVKLPTLSQLVPPYRPGRTFATPEQRMFSFYVLNRYLFSCLVDSDYLDTENFMTPSFSRIRMCEQRATISELKARLDKYMIALMKDAEDTPVNRARKSIYEDCLAASESKPGLFQLEVPTGGGKTLSSLAFALAHALRYGLRRVIVSIPYTSIVEQTAGELKQIFGAENVLEHHSNYDFSDLDDEEKIKQRLAIQNWDAPIIVTTNVQLFESLFANRPAKSRKVHNIAKSVVILDEVQVLPDPLLKPSLAMMEELTFGYDVTMVLCTATQPALSSLWPFGSKPQDIVKHRELFYGAFSNRVSYEGIDELKLAGLAQHLVRVEQVLCIVGTRNLARLVYDQVVDLALQNNEVIEKTKAYDEGYFHLSALMTPDHRSRMLKRIRSRLENGQRCVVVSTQLIEAGVDVDFPEVYRELAGLDSLVQAAGRCNRSGRIPEGGRVHIFELLEESLQETPSGKNYKKSPTWLENLKNITRNLIREKQIIDESLIAEYFDRRYGAEELDLKEIFKALSAESVIENDSINIPFETCAQKYRFIEDQSVPLFVPWESEAQALLEEMLSSDNPAEMALRLQRFSVGVPQGQLMNYAAAGALNIIEPFHILNKNDCQSFYREDVGLLKPGEEELATLIS